MKLFQAVVPTMLAAVLLTAGCTDAGNAHSENAPAHDHAEGMSLRLNQGAKWQADDHTRAAVKAMRSELADSTSGNEALGKKLQTQQEELIRGCTMTGTEHDQLHVWLNLLAPAIDRLAADTDAARSPDARKEVAHLLDEFDKYFQ